MRELRQDPLTGAWMALCDEAVHFDGVPAGKVARAMSQPVVSIARGSDLFTVADALRSKGIRRAPVMDGDTLVGVVTVKDVDKALLAVLEARSAVKRAPHTPGAAWE